MPIYPQTVSGTVALDAGSLAALENISVTFPATQPVSLASAPVTPVTDNGGSLTVDGTVGINGSVGVFGTVDIYPGQVSAGIDDYLSNYNSTLPVSGTVTAAQATASSLKAQAQILNSAGSLITYAESGTYGSPSIDVISVQNPQGTSAAIATFTSTTASSALVSATTARKTLTVYNSGAGDLYISPTATCTTTNFQVKLASNDYWECPAQQVTLAHTAVFGSAGTAYVTTIS